MILSYTMLNRMCKEYVEWDLLKQLKTLLDYRVYSSNVRQPVCCVTQETSHGLVESVY